MVSLGFEDARLTGAGSDGGIDIAARKAVAQVKHWSSPVGRPEVQRLAGAARGRTAIFIASKYSRQAMDWADQAGIALFTYTQNANVSARNLAAGRLLSSRSKGVRETIDRDFALRAERAERWFAVVNAEMNRRGRAPRPLTRRERKEYARYVDALAEMRKARASLAKVEQARSARLGRRSRFAVRVGGLENDLKAVARLLRISLPE